MSHLQLIIPCYNESQRLDRDSFLQFIDNHPQVTILFVNDGSGDHTLSVLQELTLQHNRLTVLDLQPNRGKAEAVRQGVLHLLRTQKTEFIGFWDADLATPLSDVDEFLRIFVRTPHVDLVLGSRIRKLGNPISRKLSRHLFGRVFATFVSLMLRLKVYDSQCGAKIARREVARRIFADPFVSRWFFDVELLWRQVRINPDPDRCFEFPVSTWRDVAGSKLTFQDFLRTPIELLRIYLAYRNLPRPLRADQADAALGSGAAGENT